MNTEIPVREIMDREYVGVTESDGLIETVELLLDEDKETAVVMHGSEHVGVVTERDVLSLLVDGPEPSEATVADAMTEYVPTVSPDETASAAADRLSAEPSRRLVVTNGSEPQGVVTEQDLLAGRSFATEQDAVSGVGEEAVAGVSEEAMAGGGSTAAQPEIDGFEDQGICEACGSLTSDLASFNGQLLCVECREM